MFLFTDLIGFIFIFPAWLFISFYGLIAIFRLFEHEIWY